MDFIFHPNIKLPYPHVSYSQLNSWNKTRTHRDYVKRYFFKEKPFRTKELFFGADVSDELEKDNIFEVKEEYFDTFAKLPVNGVPEYHAVLSRGSYYIMAKFDRFDIKEMELIEFKTGKKAWDMSRLMLDNQTVFYSWLCYQLFNKLPKVRLFWMQTQDDINAEFGISFTGRVEEFTKQCVEADIEKIERWATTTVEEISDGFKAFEAGEDLAQKYSWR